MTPQTRVQIIYHSLLRADAARIRRRVNADRAAMRVQEAEMEDEENRACMIDVMLAAMSTETPASADAVSERVVGLHPETAKKYLATLRNRGLIKDAGTERAPSGQRRKVYLRVVQQ